MPCWGIVFSTFLRCMSFHTAWVESRCGAVALGRTYLLPPLSSGGALMVPPWLRFHIPLIGRVEDWRAGVGRSLYSLLPRPFVCECHTISTMPRFQPPPRRTQHADFFSHFVTSMTAPIASGWSGCRVGLAPTGKRRLFTAHTRNGHLRGPAERHAARNDSSAAVWCGKHDRFLIKINARESHRENKSGGASGQKVWTPRAKR